MPGILGDTSDVAGDELEVALLGEVESSGYWASYRNWIFSYLTKDIYDYKVYSTIKAK